jgi:hypothetical protein
LDVRFAILCWRGCRRRDGRTDRGPDRGRIPEERAAEYERGLQEGGIVVGARARDEQHAADLERDLGIYSGTNIRR